MPLSDEARRERAFALAYQHLARRDRSVAEMQRHLSVRNVDAQIAGEVVEELCAQGYLDDARFASRFTADRRTLDMWGRERIARRLLELGIDEALIEEALANGDVGDERARAMALLRRRFVDPPCDDRSRASALGLLVRRGYELDLAYDAVRAHAGEQAADPSSAVP
ncbi:MAG: regulatory protein RecX [Solirubrobacteraceae bacterium]|nr:MAG: hypothetical protein DLM63_12435 [Solirubrobacterales bacterium]